MDIIEVRLTSKLFIGVDGKCMVYGAYNFVHALHVALARVELGVEEQHTFYYLPVRLATLIERRVVSAVRAVRPTDLVA